MGSEARFSRGEHEVARKRVDYLQAVLRAAERRDELITLVGGADDPSVAQARLAELLSLSPQQAEGVLDLRLIRFTRSELAAVRQERDALLAVLSAPPHDD
jgi:DNA gyrase subunit A